MFVRATGLVALLFVIAVGWRLAGSSRIAEAATDTYYPAFCLGGWDTPRHASGPVETGNGDDPRAFTPDNSAYLSPDTAAQIFCGYFPVEPREKPPVSAEIRLVWNLLGADPDLPPALPPVSTPTSDTPSEPVDDLIATSTTLIDAAVASSTDTTPSLTPMPPATTPEEPPMPAVPAIPSEPTGTEQVAPADASPEPTSMIDTGLRLTGAWILSHTPVAHAQETAPRPTLSLSDWFEVSYSLDGVRWHSLGRVNAHNWKDFTVHIPLTSWEDLQNVQIMVAALPSLSERPAVYLDGMELRAESDPSLSEAASAAVSVAGDVVDSAADAITALGSKLASLFDDDPAPAPTTVVATPTTPAPARSKHRVLQFHISGASIPIPSHLPWQDADLQEGLASTTQSVMPAVTRSDDGRSFIVSGSCGAAFATIITYRNENDYRDNPRDALANVATPCESGHYTFNLGGLPDSTQGGTYYLLVGQQSATGTWTPSSALLPITIEPVEVEE